MPFKSCAHTRKKKKDEEDEEENYTLQTEPAWEHKALSEPIQFFVQGALSALWDYTLSSAKLPF